MKGFVLLIMDNILIELVNGFNRSAVPTLVIVLKTTLWSFLLAIFSISILVGISVYMDEISKVNRKQNKYIIKEKNIIARFIKHISIILFDLFICIDFILTIISIFLSLLGIPSSLLIIVISLIIKLCS